MSSYNSTTRPSSTTWSSVKTSLTPPVPAYSFQSWPKPTAEAPSSSSWSRRSCTAKDASQPPLQGAGAIYTAGFSHCPNGTLALGATTVFYQCRSGGFYNLYDRWWAEQCSAINILMRQCDDQGQIGPNNHSVGSVMITTTMVVPLADGQPQVITTTIAGGGSTRRLTPHLATTMSFHCGSDL